MPLPNSVKEKLEYVASYVRGSLTDWFLLKTVILQSFRGIERKAVGLSKRHRSTKKMFVNDTDKEVIEYWELLTGVKLWIDPQRLHNPNWISRPKGWALNGGKERAIEEEANRKKNGDSSSDH